MRTTPRLAPALLALAACGDNLPAPEDEGPDVSAGRTLTGDQAVHYRLLDRTLLSQEPGDLWSTVVEAHVPDGDGWKVVPGIGHRDGSFAIDNLPDGHVWLRTARRPYGDTFFWTDADHVSFGEDVLGAAAPPAADDGQQLRLAVDGLAPWQESDELGWYVPEDDVFDNNLVWFAPPAADTTDLGGLAVDWTGRSLADVHAGEPSLLVQYRTQKIGGLELRAPVRSASVSIAQRPDDAGTLDATLTDPPVLSYHLTWARDVFEAQRTAINPTRTGPSYGHGFALIAMPGMVDDELWIGSEYSLATLTDPSVLEGTTPLDLGELAIPNPFPRAWLVDSYVVTFPVDFPLPDGTPATLEAVVGQRTTALAGANQPLVTPLLAPTIGGHDAFGPVTGVGTTPEIAWTAPAIGTPTSYRLQVIEAVTQPPFPYRPGWYVAAELFVPGDVTHVRVPADVLRPDATYAIVARTFAQPGHDVRTRPWVSRGTAGFADTIFGPFSP